VVFISVKILKQFWEQYPESKTAIQKWAAEIKQVDWKFFADIKHKRNLK